jgi:hypothetical protein
VTVTVRLAILVALLDAVDRVAERARWALLHGGDDLLHRCAVRVDPRLLLHAEDRLQAVRAEPGVRAQGAVVVDGDLPARVARAVIVAGIGELAIAEPIPRVRAVAERLVLRAAATAERDPARRDARIAVFAAKIRYRHGRGIGEQVIRAVFEARDPGLGACGAHRHLTSVM